MNASLHAKLSCRDAGTTDQKDFDFFYKLHDFMDCSKETESTNLHRIFFHSMWGIKRVAIPIFGHTYTCANGRQVNIKDDLEKNHVAADFGNKFLPTLADYVSLIKDDPSDLDYILEFQLLIGRLYNIGSEEVSDLMMSPLVNTGTLKSLLVTHNSWFFLEIVANIFPEIGKQSPLELKDHFRGFSPSGMFSRMIYADWVQNGIRGGYPPSYEKIKAFRQTKINKPSPLTVN